MELSGEASGMPWLFAEGGAQEHRVEYRARGEDEWVRVLSCDGDKGKDSEGGHGERPEHAEECVNERVSYDYGVPERAGERAKIERAGEERDPRGDDAGAGHAEPAGERCKAVSEALFDLLAVRDGVSDGGGALRAGAVGGEAGEVVAAVEAGQLRRAFGRGVRSGGHVVRYADALM